MLHLKGKKSTFVVLTRSLGFHMKNFNRDIYQFVILYICIARTENLLMQ